MSKYFTLTMAKVNIPSIQMRKRRGFNLAFLESWRFKIAMIGFAVILFLIYIVQINSLSTQGFRIKDLEKRVGQLKAENQALEIEAAEIKSSHELQSRINGLNMVAVGKIDYLSPTASTVAIAK
jgi:hypothetical protein